MTTRAMLNRVSRMTKSLPPPRTAEQVRNDQERAMVLRLFKCPVAYRLALDAADYIHAKPAGYDYSNDQVFAEMVAEVDAALQAHESAVAGGTGAA